MGDVIIGILVGAIGGFLIGLYFDTKQAIALRDQTKEILLTIGNAFNAMQNGEDFEVRVSVEGKATVVKFARTIGAEMKLEGGDISVKIDET